MPFNETRIRQPIGPCPACGTVLEVVLAVEVRPGPIHTDTTVSEAKAVVSMQGVVVGAVIIDHNCMPKTGPQTRGS